MSFCIPGAVQCICSTAECRERNELSCQASSRCYVQYTPQQMDEEAGTPQVVRGCIDENTPLLCENRRPDSYSGPWPVLHCCGQSYCNKDILPTLPTWVKDYEGKKARLQEYLCVATSNFVSLQLSVRKPVTLARMKKIRKWCLRQILHVSNF